MHVGDYVIKAKGRNLGAKGIVTNIITNDAENTIIEVLVGDEIQLWAKQLVKIFKTEKINE